MNKLGPEELFKAIFECLPLASFSCDPEGVIVAWNEAAERLYGYKKEDTLGRKIVDLILLPDESDEEEGLIRKGFSGEVLIGMRRSRRCADGRLLEVMTTLYPVRDSKGRVSRVVLVENKATDLSVPQGEMVQSEAMYRVLTESALIGVYICNQGRFLYVNEQMARVTGYSVGELLEMDPCELVHPDDMKGILKNRTEAFQGKEKVVDQYILRIRRKNGEIAFLQIMTRPIQYGDKPAHLGNCVDVTERILVEEEGVEYIDDLTFLSETAMGFVELAPEEDIYRFIAEQLKHLVSEGFIVVSSFDAASSKVTVREMLGNREGIETASKILGTDVVGSSFRIDERGRQGLTTGRLEKVSGGLFELSFRKIPQEVCRALEEELGLGEIYAIGFSRKDEILGSVAILLSRGVELKNQEIIEAFIHQASVALQRRMAEEALHKSHEELERRVKERTRELAQINEELRESEEKYRNIVERSNDGITIVQGDLLKYVNPRLAQMLGYTCEEMGNTSFTLYLDPEEVPKLIDCYKRRMAGEDVPSIYESITRHKDGHRIYVELNVGIINYKGRPAEFVFVRDITERKRAEEALRASERKYHQLVDNLHEGIWVIDKDSFTTFVNPRMAQMLGYTEEEMQGRHLFSFMHEPGVRLCKRYLERRRQGIKEQHEFEFLKKDETRIYTLLETSPITDDEGNYMGASAAVRDITERKKAEEALKDSEERFRQLAENIHETFWLTEWAEQKVLYISPAYETIWGRSCQSLYDDSCSWSYNIHPDDRDRVVEAFNKKAELGQYDEIYRIVREDGTIRWIHDRAFPIHDASGKVWRVAGISEDITEHKRAEERIKLHSQELSTLLEITTAVSATLDEKEVTRLIAQRATELIGADGCTVYRFDPKTEMLIPKTTTILQDREKRLAYHIVLGEGITGRAALERRPILANNVHLDGSAIRIPGVKETPRCLLVVPLVAHGELWGVMTLVRLSEEGFRERDLDLFGLFANQVADAAVNSSLFSRLRESEEKYRSFVEQAIDGIVIIQDGRIVFANRAAADLGGHENLVGMEFQDLVAPEVRDEMLDRYRRRIAGEQVPSVYETQLLARDGKVFDVELNAGIIRYEGATADLVFVRDIRERKQAEEALREEKNKAQKYLDVAGVMMTVIGSDQRVMSINKKGCEILGYSEEEVLGKNWFDNFVPGNMSGEVRGPFERMMSGEREPSEHFENPILTKSGEERMILWHNSVLKDETGNIVGVLSSGEDITERKRAEEALRESERVLSTLMSNLPGMAYRCLNDEDWTMKFVSEGCYALTGYQREDLIDNKRISYAKLISPQDQGYVWEGVQEALKEKRPFKLLYRILTSSGEERWVWEQGQGVFSPEDELVALEGFITDITDRKHAEEALREREELYRTLVNSAEEGIGLVDYDERFLFVNPKMANLVGYGQKELIGKSLLELVPHDEVEFIRSESLRRMKGETSRYETTLIHKTGTPRKVLVNAAPIFDAEGEFYATLGVLTDITDLKKVEDELRLRLIYQTAFAEIMNRAIGIENLDTFIQGCLEILGNALGVSRVYLATGREVSEVGEEMHPSVPKEEPRTHVKHEWFNQGIESSVGSDYPYPRMPYIYKLLKDDEVIATQVSSLPEPDSRVFQDEGAISVILAPIYLRDGFYGFITAEECREERQWSNSETEAFRTAVRLIGTVIDRYFEQQERRVAEEARIESEQRYRTLVETSSDIIFLLSPSGEPLYGSPSVEKMGYKREDILREPKAFLKVIAPDDVVMLGALFSKALREGKPIHDIDCEVYDSRGRSHWFAVSWNLIRDEGGRVLAVQGVARDITERKQAERALRLRMEYEKVLFEISSLLLSEGVSDFSLVEFLERLGRVTEVSRVYLFSHEEENARPFMKRIHRWVSEEASWLDDDRMDKVYYDQGFERWLRTLSTGEAIPGLTDDLPASEREVFEAERILAILVLPIFVEGRFWGAIGFDETKRKREWNIEDIRLLWTASQILSSALATESKAKELALSYEDLQERERRISELNLRLVKAEEDERRRIARVLHDEIAQLLTGVSLALSDPELTRGRKAWERLGEVKKMVKDTQNFIRDLSYELLPPALDNLGLAAAVHALARSVAEGTGVSFVIEGDDDFPRSDPDTEIMLYRIIQEAVTNALKHAEPEEITVRFEYREPVLRVRVEDDGKGFDVEKIMSVSTGLGLRSIHERVAMIGGRIELSSSVGKGTQLLVEVEIPRSSDKLSMEE